MSAYHQSSSTASEVRLRAEVARAADILFPVWPIGTFIAVNPLGNLAQMPFGEAIAEAEHALGATCYPGPELFRRARAEGRIEDGDLRAAVERARSEGRLGGAAKSAGDPLAPPEAGAPELQAPSPRELLDRRDGGRRAAAVDAEIAKWCAAYLDEGESSWSMPGRELGFYRCWRELAVADASSRRLGAGDLRAAAQRLPDSPAEALGVALAELGVDDSARIAALRRLLARNHGWASAVRWQVERRHRPEHPIDLVDYLAVMSFYENALAVAAEERADPSLARPTPYDGEEDTRRVRLELWLDAYEWHYRDRLLADMARNDANGRTDERPRAQAIFCIDARSEGLRRHLESTGNYETLGFAGFFGLAIRHRPLGTAPGSGTAQCPVLLSPAAESTERPLVGSEAPAERWIAQLRSEAAGIEAFHQVKNDLSSKFALAEFCGWAFGPAAALRTLMPGLSPSARRPNLRTAPLVDRPTQMEAEAMAAELEREIVRELIRIHLGAGRAVPEHEIEQLRKHAMGGAEPPTRPRRSSRRRWTELLAALGQAGLDTRFHEDRVEEFGALGLSRAEQSQWARVALTMMGLTERFGRLVLLCGHGAGNVNNPFRSSLDCGACGGNHGGPNARLAAALLNSEPVREDLAATGIEIPTDTRFVAGLHDTTTDRVEMFDPEQVPVTHRGDLLELERDLARAGEGLSAERLVRLGAAPHGAARPASRKRSLDWAQIRPEWGLARNAAFIVGPREMTADLDLECRSFLHSYRAEVDPEGRALETILTAPLVVAEWINLQYYFSTVDPERFGAGDKTIHNVVGRRGVQLGAGGDLRIGLPRQAVFVGERPYHEAMRLLAVVQAPLGQISEIVSRNAVLREMLGGGWAAMCARERTGEPWQRLRRDLGWEPWRPADPGLLETQTATDGGAQWVATA